MIIKPETPGYVLKRTASPALPWWRGKEHIDENFPEKVESPEWFCREATWGEFCEEYGVDPQTGEDAGSFGRRGLREEVERQGGVSIRISDTEINTSKQFAEAMVAMNQLRSRRPAFSTGTFFGRVSDAGGLELPREEASMLLPAEVREFILWLCRTFEFNTGGSEKIETVEQLAELVASFRSVEIAQSRPQLRDAIDTFVTALQMSH